MAQPVKMLPAKTRVVVATTVMLSFISFWRVAAIVLNDLGSSAFYVGGIAEHAIGRAAPWFILGVMLFASAVRALYVESCVMFTRGGVYRVVKKVMGGTAAKISVSALLFDYILTGPISGVSAGQYIVGLIAQILTVTGHPWVPPKETINLLAAGIAILILGYFWWRNIQGIHESSSDALNIMKVTTVMVVGLIVWSVITLVIQGPVQIPPLPLPQNLQFSHEAMGWARNVFPGGFEELPSGRSGILPNAGIIIALFGIFMAFGHSILAMSGEESLAQVNREIEHPKLKNLIRAAIVIFVYSLLFTSLVSIFASLIIPDSIRPQYFDNLISGLSMHFIGPLWLRLAFQGFVVIVGFLMLSGAVNTAIIGSNGVLNRVSEDGVLVDWFRAPHKKYGTTYRLINLICLLQIATIIISRGNIYLLGEAYAFGVVWSFTFNGLSMVILRWKDRQPREWQVPLNIRIGKVEIPIGISLVAFVLLMIAITNLITKQVATISGLSLTVIFFTIFSVSEYLNKKKHAQTGEILEHFSLNYEESITTDTVQVRPGNVVVAVRDYNTLEHLERALEKTDTDDQDIVVVTIRQVAGSQGGVQEIYRETTFSEYEQKLFSRVVTLSEDMGKPVHLLTVPATNIFDAVAQTVALLDSSEVVAGLSSKMNAWEQSRQLGLAWDRFKDKHKKTVLFRVVEGKNEHIFSLGPHAPQLTGEDIDTIHHIWLRATTRLPLLRDVHHHDVIQVALKRLERDLEVEGFVDFLPLRPDQKKK